MHNSTLVLAAAAIIALGACAGDQTTVKGASNPLLDTWTAPFGAPPLDTIRTEHFQPAFDEAIRIHNTEIAAITAQAEAPTFANTVEALERSGELLERIRLAFVNLNDAHTSDALQAVAKVVNPLQTSHKDDILLNEALFERVEAVYEQRDKLDLDTEQQRLLDKTYQRFVRGGANLDDEAKAQLRALNDELSTLSTQFGENVLKEMNAVALLIDRRSGPRRVCRSRCATRPPRWPKRRATRATGPSTCSARAGRRSSSFPSAATCVRQLYTAYTDLGRRRHRKRQPGDRRSHRRPARRAGAAARVTRPTPPTCSTTTWPRPPERVDELLDRLWKPALARAEAERAEMQALADERGRRLHDRSAGTGGTTPRSCARPSTTSTKQAVKPYLAAGQRTSGRLRRRRQAVGVCVRAAERRAGLPPRCAGVRGQETPTARSSASSTSTTSPAKANAAAPGWRTTASSGRKTGSTCVPIIVNVCNFSKPSEGQPALLSLDEAGNPVPRVRPRAARPAGRRHATPACRAPTCPGLRRAAVADDGELGLRAGGPADLRAAPRDRRADPARADREAADGQAVQPGLRHDRVPRGVDPGHGLAHPDATPARRDADAFEAERVTTDRADSRDRAPAIARRTSATSSPVGTPPATTATSGPRCWTPTASRRSRRRGSSTTTWRRSYRENILEAGDSEAPMVLYERFRGGQPSIQPLLVRRGLL